MAKVGEKGQIVIPKEVRDMFVIRPGESIVILADSSKGIILVGEDFVYDSTRSIFNNNNLEEDES